jgi:anti-sigma factor RsiW
MNCTELKELLMPYADGELDPEQAAAVQSKLADCAECRAELEEIQRVSAFARVAFTAPVAGVDLSGVYGRVMAQVAVEQRGAEPSVWVRTAGWLREVMRFERPMALAGMAAAVVAIVVGVMQLGSSPNPVPSGANGGDLARTDESVPGLKRRDAEHEVRAGGRNTAYVEGWEVARGKVFIEQSAEDPDQPLVLWHVVDEDGQPVPKGL